MTDRWGGTERELARYGYDVTRLPRLGDGVQRTVSYVAAYNELVAVARDRAVFLGELLQAQLDRANLMRTTGGDIVPQRDGGPAREGDQYQPVYDVFVEKRFAMATTVDEEGNTETEPVPIGESIRALIELEAAERDRVHRLVKDALRIGVELNAAETARTYGEVGAYSVKALVVELGLDPQSEDVLIAMRRSVYAGRRAAGQDEGDPDEKVGPRLSEAARERARRPARRLPT